MNDQTHILITRLPVLFHGRLKPAGYGDLIAVGPAHR